MEKTQDSTGKDKFLNRLRKWLKTYFGLDDGIALFLMFVGVVCHFLSPESEKQKLYSLLFDLRTELIGAGIATLLIGNASQAAQIKEEKKRLILQMGSPDNGFAVVPVRQLRKQGWLEDGSLKGVSLNRADLSGAILYGANLSGGDMYRTNLSRSDLQSASLSGAWMWEANLSEALLWEANLSGAKLNMANLSGADLGGANLSGAKFCNQYLFDSASFDETTKWKDAFYTEGEKGTVFPEGFNPANHEMHKINKGESYGEAYKRVDPFRSI